MLVTLSIQSGIANLGSLYLYLAEKEQSTRLTSACQTLSQLLCGDSFTEISLGDLPMILVSLFAQSTRPNASLINACSNSKPLRSEQITLDKSCALGFGCNDICGVAHFSCADTGLKLGFLLNLFQRANQKGPPLLANNSSAA